MTCLTSQLQQLLEIQLETHLSNMKEAAAKCGNKVGRRGTKKCSHCRRMKQRCERISDNLPCRRCEGKGRVCGSYLPRDDPKLPRQPKLVIDDPTEIEVLEQFRKKSMEATNLTNNRPGFGGNRIEESVQVMPATADLEEMWEVLDSEWAFGRSLLWG